MWPYPALLLTNAADGSMANELYRVRGVLRGMGDAIDRGGVFMNAAAWRTLVVVPDGAHQIIVRRPPGVSLAAARAVVAGLAPDEDVRSWVEILPTLASILETQKASMVLVDLIVYAAVAGQSVVKLYAAAMFPGFFLSFLYLVYIIGWAMINPKIAPKLSEEQKEALKQLVETGPDPATDGVVRWRCVDLKRVLGQRFGVDLSEVSLGRVLKKLGFSHRRITSGAGHDACNLNTKIPAAMVFVPCKDGISHNELEDATQVDCTAGANVLMHTVLALAGVAS